MEVQVWYEVPVAVHVDTETGEVTRVVVIDEEIHPEPQRVPHVGDCDVTLADFSGPAPEDVAKRAREIAESQEWTVWENGY